MSLEQLLTQLEISDIPDIWQKNWDFAMAAYPADGIAFLNPAYIKEMRTLFILSDDVWRDFHKTAAVISASEPLCQFTWLWYYTLFLGEDKNDAVTGDWPAPIGQLGTLTDMFYGVILLGGIPALKQFYASRGIPDEILLHTLTDLAISMDEYHIKFKRNGVSAYFMYWLLKHFRGNLFRLGRLQFMYITFADDKKIYRNRTTDELCIDCGNDLEDTSWELVLQKGDGLLDTHIPRGEPMTPEACRDSYNLALMYFQKHFPELTYKGFTCGSWLLSPELKEILPSESNIIQFQNAYFIYRNTDSEDYFEYVFGADAQKDAELPEHTSLQRAVKKYIKAGRGIYSAEGVILLERP